MSGGVAEERLVLVDADDVAIGTAEKLRAHRDGALHRAFSVLVFDTRDQLLLQRRAGVKYHSAGLWSNTCCGHPRPGEDTAAAAHRRLGEEMGFDCPLDHAFVFTYRASLGNGLVEHEIDHVFVGRADCDPDPDPSEVDAWRRMPLGDVQRAAADRPAEFTVWFHILLQRLASSHVPDALAGSP